MWFKPALSLLKQHIRRGELTLFILAIALAVTSVFSLSGFSDRLNQALTVKGSQFLAADRVLSSAYPIDTQILAQAQKNELTSAHILSFNAMVFAKDKMILSFTKAIEGPYPLRGDLKISAQTLTKAPLSTQGAIVFGPPPVGTVWISPQLSARLNVDIADTIEVGDAILTISGIITEQPDASFSVFKSSPTIMINHLDIPATQVVQPGSRLSYDYLYRGTPQSLSRFYQQIHTQLETNHNWQDINGERSPLAQALKLANDFLLLASLLGIILAATAISVSANHFTQHQFDTVALLKTLGSNNATIAKILSFHLSVLALLGIGLGLILGYLLQSLALNFIVYYFPGALPTPLPQLAITPVLMAVATGIICTLLCALMPMFRLFNIPVIRVIQRHITPTPTALWKSSALFAFTIFTLLLLYSHNLTLSLILLLIVIVIAIVLNGLARLIIHLARHRHFDASSPWALAIASLHQRANQASVQIASSAIAMMLMLLVILLRNELINDWQRQLPTASANHFLANVTPEQVPQINQLMAQYDVVSSELFPVIRGRVAKINNDNIAGYNSEKNEQTPAPSRRGFERELSLTWRIAPPVYNPIIEGTWWDERDSTKQVSIASGAAKRLNINIGDNLTTLVGAQVITATVTSIRQVQWQSMRPNFVLIFNQAALGDMPSTYISSFYLADEQHPLLTELFNQFPTVSLINIDILIEQLRQIMQQVSLALSYIMLWVMAAAALVLLVQIKSSYQHRHRDLVVLRTLGASKKLLKRAIAIEFIIMGALAGGIAALATECALWLLQSYVIKMSWQPHYQLWLIATLVGGIFVGAIGTYACKSLTRLPPSTLIRNLS